MLELLHEQHQHRDIVESLLERAPEGCKRSSGISKMRASMETRHQRLVLEFSSEASWPLCT